MKRVVAVFLLFSMLFLNVEMTSAITEVSTGIKKEIKYNPNAKVMKYAFIFDGPSDKNAQVLKYFQDAIRKSSAPDFKAEFPKDLIYVGNWSESNVKALSDKALNSNASTVISLGYFSSQYLSQKKDKKKFVITIDQYGIRDFGTNFFNPVQQSAKGIKLFQQLVHFNQAALLINEKYYKITNNWAALLKEKLPGINIKVIPVNSDIDGVISKMDGSCDAAILTYLFNISVEKKKELIDKLNAKKIPTFAFTGKEDVELGVLLGIGALDVDKKIAEATSFNIKTALLGETKKSEKIKFYEDEIFYINKDTANLIGYMPHLRILNNAEIITKKIPPSYNLTAVFNKLETQNLDIERKKLLVKVARKASLAANLKYLPTVGATLGYQQYNGNYAESVKLSIPEKTGIFSFGVDQIIYSPALVTNILIKKKNVSFAKEEAFLTEQNIEMDVALLYIETLMLANRIKVQKEYVKESRENLAMARVREKTGFCGKEEIMRWAAQLNTHEQILLDMDAEYRNLKISINKLLFDNQKNDFDLAPLKANDPAFYTSELNVIDYVATPYNLEQFTKMLIEEAYSVSPELAKLRLALKMKNDEMHMYYQKFILPDAKLNLEYTTLMNREYAGPAALGPISALGGATVAMTRPEPSNLRFGAYAKWTPIEGGTKIAEIQRIKAEKAELEKYSDEVKTVIEEEIRSTINKAIAGYFSVEKKYKAMFAAQENYQISKNLYLRGKLTIAQLLDAQTVYLDSKTDAMNSQYVFFKELFWVQRAICAVNWNNASPSAKMFIDKVKNQVSLTPDISL